MRIIAGSAKGTRLAPVPARVRPLSDRAREGLFSSLGQAVPGARVLDLYAGTGGMGIEALSRGAERALFVDSSPAAVAAIEENLRRTNLSARATVRRMDVMRALAAQPGRFDLVFVDPPYRLGSPDLDALLSAIQRRDVAGPGTTVVLTRGKRSSIPVIPLDWRLSRRLGYGDAAVYLFEAPEMREG